MRVYVRFVTKCFGSNISMGLFVGGCGFRVVSTFCLGGFYNGSFLIGPLRLDFLDARSLSGCGPT